MSFTTVSETSVNAYRSLQTKDTKISRIENLLLAAGPKSATDISLLVGDISRSRLADAQRDRGSVRKTGAVQKSANDRDSEIYEYVPDVGKLRLRARLEYWQARLERHQEELAQQSITIDKDTAMIRVLKHQVEMSPLEAEVRQSNNG